MCTMAVDDLKMERPVVAYDGPAPRSKVRWWRAVTMSDVFDTTAMMMDNQAYNVSLCKCLLSLGRKLTLTPRPAHYLTPTPRCTDIYPSRGR